MSLSEERTDKQRANPMPTAAVAAHTAGVNGSTNAYILLPARFLKLTDGAGGGASSGAVGAAAGAAAGVGSGSGAFFPFAGDALLPPVERFLGAIPILSGTMGRWRVTRHSHVACEV